jgi:hypothetical protein
MARSIWSGTISFGYIELPFLRIDGSPAKAEVVVEARRGLELELNASP